MLVNKYEKSFTFLAIIYLYDVSKATAVTLKAKPTHCSTLAYHTLRRAVAKLRILMFYIKAFGLGSSRCRLPVYNVTSDQKQTTFIKSLLHVAWP